MPETAIVPIEDYAILKNDNKLPELIRANMGDQGLDEMDLDRLKIPAGGGTYWNVPTLDGEKPEERVTGVIIGHRDGRVYWAQGLDAGGGSQPPDCVSQNAVAGIGDPGGKCDECSLAQFGSAQNGGGKGQACKQIKLLFIMRPDVDGQPRLLPMAISLPPTSLKPARKYLLRLASMCVPYWGIETQFTLEETKNAGGITYTRAVLRAGRALDAETAARFRAIGDAMMPQLNRVNIGEEAPF